uniref:Uncharacterized protein n=1 Tax=Aegilops tauschii subsp. strangulata TaxID=200361 RepID=A0A453IBR1_AEGTS
MIFRVVGFIVPTRSDRSGEYHRVEALFCAGRNIPAARACAQL